ncbi:MAG: GNAT family N-acetyltransferase, partial [Actinomycetota bacterium]
MFAPISTERLVVRSVRPDDVDVLHARRNDPEVARLQNWTLPYPRERATAIVEGSIELGGPRDGHWWMAAIEERATGRFVGDLAVHLSFGGRSAEIGYSLDTDHRGRGFATEAVDALLDHLVEVVGVR